MAPKKTGASSGGGLATAGFVVAVGLGAVLMALLASSHANALPDGFILEDLDSMREFLRHPSLAGLRAGASEVWAIFGPGGRLHPGWFLEHKGHLVIEGLLAVTIAVMLLQSRFSPKATEEEDGLTEKVRAAAVGRDCVAVTGSARPAALHQLALSLPQGSSRP
jgi:hypothetical protein